MPNSSQKILNLISSANSIQFQCEWTLFHLNNKNTEYKTKFRLPKGPKQNVLMFSFSHIFR